MTTTTTTTLTRPEHEVLLLGPDSTQPATSFYFPKLLRNFDWNRGFNEHYEKARAESNAWLFSLHPFSKKGQEAFEGWDFPYLAAVSYYGGSYSTFRSICDITNIFFVIDEQTDDEPVDVVTERCEMAMDAILRPEKPRPAGECRKYLDSVIVQAKNRSRKHILHPEDYLRERVDNIGIWPSVAIGEQCLRLEIPHEYMEHPYLKDIRT
ncbi:hypothetical protein E8E14_001877 [Neopestalotiopsis sp. 37M]|nr:hypothetical protein E8E14_001877 [Neopestalotiopsis sp. 37M]